MARSYVEQTNLKWPLLIDESKDLYRAYSMERGSWWSIVGPVSIWKYVTLLLRGRKLQKSGSDYQQLGGDILIDPSGVVRMHYVSSNPHDRPSPESILKIINDAGAKTTVSG